LPAFRQIKRYVAAIVDERARDSFTRECSDQFVGDTACNGRHWRDKTRAVRMARGPHAARNMALQRAIIRRRVGADGPPKHFQFTDQFRQYVHKTRPARIKSSLQRGGFSVGAEDQIDRPVLPMPAGCVDADAGWAHSVVVTVRLAEHWRHGGWPRIVRIGGHHAARKRRAFGMLRTIDQHVFQ